MTHKPYGPYEKYLKRPQDFLCALLATIVLSPIMLITAILVAVKLGRPVLFTQERPGRNEKIFKIYKFRTMTDGRDERGNLLPDEVRLTSFGKKLRSTSLDELPELFNILKGDMSVVGPRPCVTYELGDFDTLNRRYKKRFEVKAGLTGLAQVKGRNDISWDEKVGYDNRYVDDFKRFGVLTDIVILIESVFKVFRKEQIYENKADENMTDAEAARYEEDEIIRIAHLPD